MSSNKPVLPNSNKSKHRAPDTFNVRTLDDPEVRNRVVKEYTIDLGSAGRGYRRYKVLVHLLRDIIALNRRRLDYQDANTLQLYRKTLRFKIALESPFIIWAEPDEWHALSRGLRALGTAPAKTLYQWMNNHKSMEFEP